MKLAVSNIAWDLKHDQQALRLLLKHGISGIEIAPTKVWNSPISANDANVLEYANFWINNGIVPVAIQSVLFNHPELVIFKDERTRAKTLVYLKQMIKVASLLGAKVLVFGSPKNRLTYGHNPDLILEIATHFFRELGDSSKEHGIHFCIEPNAKEYGCDFITNNDEGIELIKRINHEHVRLNLDIGISYLNKELFSHTLERSLPYIHHIHISEPYLGLMGKTSIDHGAIARAIGETDYQGWVSLEMKQADSDIDLTMLDESLGLFATTYN